MLENLKIAVGCEANYHQIRFNLVICGIVANTKKKKNLKIKN